MALKKWCVIVCRTACHSHVWDRHGFECGICVWKSTARTESVPANGYRCGFDLQCADRRRLPNQRTVQIQMHTSKNETQKMLQSLWMSEQLNWLQANLSCSIAQLSQLSTFEKILIGRSLGTVISRSTTYVCRGPRAHAWHAGRGGPALSLMTESWLEFEIKTDLWNWTWIMFELS